MTATKVRVRAQAFDGKFIGDKVAKAPQLTVLVDGIVVQSGLTIENQDSGTVVTASSPGTTSSYPIIVQPPQVSGYEPPGTYWLEPPPAGDSDCVVTLDLPAIAVVEFRVTAFAPQPVTGAITQVIVPGNPAYMSQLGIVVPVHGLYVPAFTATRVSGSNQVNVQATAAMLCGCPIGCPGKTPPPELYWPAAEFNVFASFIPDDGSDPVTAALTCNGTNQFAGTANLSSNTGWQGTLEAAQRGTSNSGWATTAVTLSSS